jgi:hypothetical protein
VDAIGKIQPIIIFSTRADESASILEQLEMQQISSGDQEPITAGVQWQQCETGGCVKLCSPAYKAQPWMPGVASRLKCATMLG